MRYAVLVAASLMLIQPAHAEKTPDVDPRASLGVVQQWIYNYRAKPDYAPLHAAFPATDARPRGEATPIYVYWPGCLERIAAYDPAMKLVLLFRDPIERALQLCRDQGKTGCTLYAVDNRVVYVKPPATAAR